MEEHSFRKIFKILIANAFFRRKTKNFSVKYSIESIVLFFMENAKV